MGLITKEVEVELIGKSIKYYKDIGYKIPMIREKSQYKKRTGTRKRKIGKLRVKQGTTIMIKVSDLPKRSEVKVMVKCDCCKEEKEIGYRNYYEYNHDGKYYCNKCHSKIFLFNESITDEERLNKRAYKQYKYFVNKCMNRDNYTCKCCGDNTGGNLNVHHLDGYNWAIEKRTDIDNGITLCEICHEDFHKIYGKGNNTKEQFQEWINDKLSNQPPSKLNSNLVIPMLLEI